jgi:hypothetical protein
VVTDTEPDRLAPLGPASACRPLRIAFFVSRRGRHRHGCAFGECDPARVGARLQCRRKRGRVPNGSEQFDRCGHYRPCSPWPCRASMSSGPRRGECHEEQCGLRTPDSGRRTVRGSRGRQARWSGHHGPGIRPGRSWPIGPYPGRVNRNHRRTMPCCSARRRARGHIGRMHGDRIPERGIWRIPTRNSIRFSSVTSELRTTIPR